MEEVPAKQHKIHAPVQRQIQDLAERVERVAKVQCMDQENGWFLYHSTVFNVGTRMSDKRFNQCTGQGETSRWTKPPVDIKTKVPF